MSPSSNGWMRVGLTRQDHHRGPLDAPLQLVEYGDFECPFCGRAYVQVEELVQTLGDRLCFAFRHFPLAESHPHALIAAEAAEAAGVQGRFWQMHHALYEHQDALEADALVQYAKDIGLDVRRFSEDLAGHRLLPRVRRDFLTGVRSGVKGTPTFFINGQRYDGPHIASAILDALRTGRGRYAYQ